MENKTLLTPQSVVLVSGGGRGITARCVIMLAERVRCKFILLGRTSLERPLPDWARQATDDADLKKAIVNDIVARGEKPVPAHVQKVFRNLSAQKEIEETLAAIRQAGAQVEYVSADITDGQAMQQQLALPVHRLGKITGVIHGAGNLADKLIEKKTAQDFDSVVLPKVKGLENLLAVAPAGQLDFLVLFSSIVGFFGNVGQTDYAIANEILNKAAYQIQTQNPHCRVISINWGPWEAGMVTPELKKMFEERGVQVIPVDAGANMLLRELLPDENHPVQVVVGNPPARPAEPFDPELKQYQIRRRLTLEANPFLYDHTIGDHPVLPATCAATWAVHSIEQLYPGYFFIDLTHYRVLKGIVFNATLADEYVMEIKETAKNAEGEIDFKVLIWSTNERGRTIYHYTLDVKLGRQVPPPPHHALPDVSGALAVDGSRLYTDGTLFHGPAFQGVQRVLHVDEHVLRMECVLPEVAARVQGQFPVITGNPFLYDTIVQSVLIWAQFIKHAPCLPSRVDRFEQFKAVPFGMPVAVEMQVVSQSETSVVTDVTVVDGDGQVCVRITHLEGTISPALNRLIGRKEAQAQVLQAAP